MAKNDLVRTQIFVRRQPRGFHKEVIANDRHPVGYPDKIVVFVRDGYHLEPCDGAAHTNPHEYDYCSNCMKGIWGFKPVEDTTQKYEAPKSLWDRIHAGEFSNDSSTFNDAVIESLGLVGHPKANELMSIAYQLGHASGFGDVYNYAIELSSLLK